MSDDGYFTLCGRESELIISGGFNIYPREIEDVLSELPAVREAVVVGAPDERRGEVPVAYIVAPRRVRFRGRGGALRPHAGLVQGAARVHSRRRAAEERPRQGAEAPAAAVCLVKRSVDMNRRQFVISSASAVAGLAVSRTGWGQSAPAWKSVKPATLERISIMTLNFQSLLKLPDYPDSPDRTLEPFTIAEMLADRYGVHKVEFQHYHIPSTEPSYLKELRAHIEKSRSRMTQINVEFGQLNISAPQLRDRLMAIDLTKMWIDHAAMLGAQRVMINQGQPTQDNKVHGIPTLKTMVDYGRSKGIIVSVETRGGSVGDGADPMRLPPARRRRLRPRPRPRSPGLPRGHCWRKSSKARARPPTSTSAAPVRVISRNCTSAFGCSFP